MPTTDTLVLLHGLGRTSRSMRRLAAHAVTTRTTGGGGGGGYRHVHNIGYPTRAAGVWAHAQQVGRRLAALANARGVPLDVVAHSLGGVVLRAAVAGGWLPASALRHVVMLAPPNQGSELADVLTRRAAPLFRLAVGPSGPELCTGPRGVASRLPPVRFVTGVITGTRGALRPRWLRQFGVFPGPHDGKVSVARAVVPGMRDFLTVRRGHTFVMNAPEVIMQVFHFLEHGAFAPASEVEARCRHATAAATTVAT